MDEPSAVVAAEKGVSHVHNEEVRSAFFSIFRSRLFHADTFLFAWVASALGAQAAVVVVGQTAVGGVMFLLIIIRRVDTVVLLHSLSS